MKPTERRLEKLVATFIYAPPPPQKKQKHRGGEGPVLGVPGLFIQEVLFSLVLCGQFSFTWLSSLSSKASKAQNRRKWSFVGTGCTIPRRNPVGSKDSFFCISCHLGGGMLGVWDPHQL